MLIGIDGNYRIADLGNSEVVEYRGIITTVSGTYDYSHPDVFCDLLDIHGPGFARNLEFPPEVGIWSAGAMIYEVTTGRVPFSATSDEHMLLLMAFKPPNSIRGKQLRRGIEYGTNIPGNFGANGGFYIDLARLLRSMLQVRN